MQNIESAILDQTTIIDGASYVEADHRYPHLIIFSGNNSGRRHKLRRGITTIGRSPRNDISVNDDRVSDLIHIADQALYLAKEKGRNRTESLLKHP